LSSALNDAEVSKRNGGEKAKQSENQLFDLSSLSLSSSNTTDSMMGTAFDIYFLQKHRLLRLRSQIRSIFLSHGFESVLLLEFVVELDIDIGDETALE